MILKLYTLSRRVRDKLFSVCISGAFQSFGRRTVIAMPVRLGNAGDISIGSRVGLGPNCWLQTVPIPGRPRPAIIIEDEVVSVGGTTLSAAEEIRVGRGVLFAENVYISDHNHEYENLDLPVFRQGVRDLRPVSIGDGAWLGKNVVVCPGVQIGRGAVIGANSVVRADVPAYAVAAGVPARVIRSFQPPDSSD